MKKLLLLAGISALLVACGAKNSGTSTAPAEPAAPEVAAAATPAPTETELKNATQESSDSAESATDSSLEKMVAMPANVQLPGGRWKAGTHYKPIVPAQRTSAEAGQVEVIEFMWFGCPHCADLEPHIDSWTKKKAPYVKFVQEHVMWGPAHRAHGKLLYTLQALNRTDLVAKAFSEIHVRKNILLSQSGKDAETYSLQLAFAKANGISEADFKREFNGFAVNSRLQRSEELTRRYRIETVPVIIINGKYQTDVGMAGGDEQLLQLINDLTAFEKSR